MYVDHSLPGDPMKDKLIDELNFKNCLHFKRNKTIKLFVGITLKYIYIIHTDYFDTNNIFSRPFIQNLTNEPNMVQDLSIQMNMALKKHILYNIVKHQIHHIICITSNNGKTEYRGSKYAKKRSCIKTRLD